MSRLRKPAAFIGGKADLQVAVENPYNGGQRPRSLNRLLLAPDRLECSLFREAMADHSGFQDDDRPLRRNRVANFFRDMHELGHRRQSTTYYWSHLRA